MALSGPARPDGSRPALVGRHPKFASSHKRAEDTHDPGIAGPSRAVGLVLARKASTSRQTAHSALVGESPAARMAGSRPAPAPMRTAAAMPPTQAWVGITVVQPLVWA